jgi:hypothetical protein
LSENYLQDYVYDNLAQKNRTLIFVDNYEIVTNDLMDGNPSLDNIKINSGGEMMKQKGGCTVTIFIERIAIPAVLIPVLG